MKHEKRSICELARPDPIYDILQLENSFAALTKVEQGGTYDESFLNAGQGVDIDQNGEADDVVTDPLIMGRKFRKKVENVLEMTRNWIEL